MQQDESAPGSAVMSSDDDDDDGDIPTVKVGGEEFAVTDINEELKDRMTAGEKERYTQIFQDFYSHMYDWKTGLKHWRMRSSCGIVTCQSGCGVINRIGIVDQIVFFLYLSPFFKLTSAARAQ